ncbi:MULTISPECIES: helix-turn-helix domain-containing protein [Bradyrhizobium]|uniref:Transcriptional regulatory protein n=1 Tax=Bradyrhizobium vignae TaxID=1549949 RepID=A0A2U3Q6E1_9BRAD|nr:AraC family transcriptional regulator [Bradyrhizobium vignae]SPP97003.1 Transcriptional regulatory protein [Bradyrhizobium vignae]
MSLQRSYSQNNHVTAATDVLSRRSPRSPDPRSGAEAMMFSLVHLDVSLAIEPPAPDMRTSVLGEPSFRVSAKPLARAAICSDRGTAGEEITDPVMQRLSDALAATRAMHHPDYAILLDALRLAMLTRKASWGTVVSRPRDTRAPEDREGQAARRVRSLQKWRLKRVLEYIEDNLDAKVTLQHLAAVAGLSRMYFAAQFRAAVGMRPHDYFLKRRIDRAKELMQRADVSLIDIALAVGFQTQAHFTTVFKRFTGETPYRWRSAHLLQAFPLPRADGKP